MELSFQIKQQELREKAGIKDDSKIALRKKKRSEAPYRQKQTNKFQFRTKKFKKEQVP